MLKRTVSGIMLTLLLIGMLTLAFSIQTVRAEPGTIYIRADGRIDPPTAPISTVDNVTYTLTEDILSDGDGIVVERSNIIIDGTGYSLQGTGAYGSKGIYLSGISNVTIKNIHIRGFYDCIYLYHSSYISLFGNDIACTGPGWMHCGIMSVSSSNNNISKNTITSLAQSVRLELSSNNNISENNVTSWSGGIQIIRLSSNNTIYRNKIANCEWGLILSSSSNNTIDGNVMNDNKYSFGVEGYTLNHFMHSVNVTNLVDGKPVYYLVNQKDLVINLATYPDIGYLTLVNCSNVEVKDLYLTKKAQGLLLAYTSNSSLINNTITSNYNGIQLYSSSHNSISKSNIVDNVNGIVLQSSSNYNDVTVNNITNRSWGVYFQSSSYNKVFGNKIEANDYGGILLEYSSNNSIDENNVEANDYGGVCLSHSVNNHIAGNNIAKNNLYGIRLSEHSSKNSIIQNNITNNQYGIWLYPWFNYMNVFSGNNIANNMRGIGLCWSSCNTFFGNIITNNNVGIYFYSSPFSNNKFYHNNFINNILQVQFETSGDVNFWDDGYPSGGNYWSDYIAKGGYDGDGDGIGDVPYVIDVYNQDRYPLMEPWTPLPRTIGELKTKIEECGLEDEIDNEGIVKSLIAKLNVAQKLVEKGKIDEAKSILEKDFIPQVQNLSDIHITAEAAEVLVKSAEYILSHL